MERLSVRVISSNLVRVIRNNSIILDLQSVGSGAAVTRGFGRARSAPAKRDRERGKAQGMDTGMEGKGSGTRGSGDRRLSRRPGRFGSRTGAPRSGG